MTKCYFDFFMTLRTRIFIVISLIVLFILGVSIFIIYLSKRSTPIAGQENGVNTAGEVIPVQGAEQTPVETSGASVPKQTSEEAIKNAALQMAKIFIERYASYSTDNDYQNIKEVEGLVTAGLWSRLSSKIGQPVGKEFLGVTTQAVSSGFDSYTANSATVRIQTTQIQDKNGVIAKANKEVIVHEVLSDGNWLVDKFEWK